MNKRIISAIVGAAAGLAVFAGCGTTVTPSSQDAGAPTTVTHHHKHHHKAAAPSETTSERMAILSAKQYLSDGQGFSKKGLERQLSSSYGEGFSKHDAKFAVNHIKVNWNHQAVLAANNYLNSQPMSESGLVQQLESPYADNFTHAQAVYGAHYAYTHR